jgi:hypothetical protein
MPAVSLALGVLITSRSETFVGDLTRVLFGELLGVNRNDATPVAAPADNVPVARAVPANASPNEIPVRRAEAARPDADVPVRRAEPVQREGSAARQDPVVPLQPFAADEPTAVPATPDQ